MLLPEIESAKFLGLMRVDNSVGWFQVKEQVTLKLNQIISTDYSHKKTDLVNQRALLFLHCSNLFPKYLAQINQLIFSEHDGNDEYENELSRLKQLVDSNDKRKSELESKKIIELRDFIGELNSKITKLESKLDKYKNADGALITDQKKFEIELQKICLVATEHFGVQYNGSLQKLNLDIQNSYNIKREDLEKSLGALNTSIPGYEEYESNLSERILKLQESKKTIDEFMILNLELSNKNFLSQVKQLFTKITSRYKTQK